MLVAVRIRSDYQYVDVEEENRDLARKIAYRYVHKKKEVDYSELLSTTYLPQVQRIDYAAAAILLSHLS